LAAKRRGGGLRLSVSGPLKPQTADGRERHGQRQQQTATAAVDRPRRHRGRGGGRRPLARRGGPQSSAPAAAGRRTVGWNGRAPAAVVVAVRGGRAAEPELTDRPGLLLFDAHPQVVELPERAVLEEVRGTCTGAIAHGGCISVRQTSAGREDDDDYTAEDGTRFTRTRQIQNIMSRRVDVGFRFRRPRKAVSTTLDHPK